MSLFDEVVQCHQKIFIWISNIKNAVNVFLPWPLKNEFQMSNQFPALLKYIEVLLANIISKVNLDKVAGRI